MSTTIDRQWTTRLRKRVEGTLPPEKLLPDTQPAYVASWIYVFGVTTMAALGVVIATGCILALDGPQWWHSSSLGHFVNSLHLWSVEIFFFAMVIHLWGKFAMAAWRGGQLGDDATAKSRRPLTIDLGAHWGPLRFRRPGNGATSAATKVAIITIITRRLATLIEKTCHCK